MKRNKKYSFLFCFFYLLSASALCIQKGKASNLSLLPTTFPSFFSINASLIFRHLNQNFRCRTIFSIVYDQHIHFIVQGPLCREIIRGVIDKKGITLLNRLNRVVYAWDYKRIKQAYHLDCNYLFIQSLLLGNIDSSTKDKQAIAADRPYVGLTYTYHKPSNRVQSVKLSGKKERKHNQLSFFYNHKMVGNQIYLSSINIVFCFKDKKENYNGNIILHKFYFKKLKKPKKIKIMIPSYYIHK